MLAEGRILEALADEDVVLAGTLERLSRKFQLSTDDFRQCLRDLVRAGWIAVQTQPFGRLTVRLERRSGADAPVFRERRQRGPNAWPL
ncbi:MAG: hypothetical protein U0893_01105 [Chloroflexota bacterium]